MERDISIPINLGTNTVTTQDWIRASASMNFSVYQPLLNQFERSTESSSSLQRQPTEEAPLETA